MDTVEILVISWNGDDDTFNCRILGDFEEDFKMPSRLMPAITGEYGAPHELCDNVYEVKLP